MKIKIKISYSTGDSFHTEDRESFLDIEWTKMNYAKESLQRIKNHNEYYKKHSHVYEKPDEKLPKGVLWNDEYKMLMLELINDNGKPYLCSAFWTGYFDDLHLAEIVYDDPDYKYNPRGY